MTDLARLEKRALAELTYGERLRPERDWLALLLVAALLFLASVAVNVFIYEHAKDANPESTFTAASHASTDAVSAAQKAFADRAAEQARYEHEYQFVDPSR